MDFLQKLKQRDWPRKGYYECRRMGLNVACRGQSKASVRRISTVVWDGAGKVSVEMSERDMNMIVLELGRPEVTESLEQGPN